MSYRYYLGIIPLKKYKELSTCKSKQELKTLLIQQVNSTSLIDMTRPFIFDEISYWITFDEKIKKQKFFKNNELNEKFNDDDTLFLINKMELITLINEYKNMIVNNTNQIFKEYVEEMKDTSKQTLENKDKLINDLLNELRTKITLWNNDMVIDMNEQHKKITISSKLEHQIFDLTMILKNTNFKTNKLFICAY